ncbi:MAG: TonB family protein [Zoogloeaceae bacterium]|jgi:protein TonB|nr:TonB family protein [Zoogloeaceae bacterium]
MSHSYTVPNYAAQQRDPRRFWSGIVLVALFHLVLGYALMNGLGRKILEVAQAPLSVNLLEKVKPPEPPPPPPPPPPRRVVRTPTAAPPPQPLYAPPVETPVEAPAPVITVTETPPEPAPPPAPPVPEAPPAPPAVNIAVACPNHRSVPVEMPPQAERMGLSGKVMAEFTVTASGAIRNVRVVQSSNSIFNRAAMNAIAQYRCIGQGHEARVRVPFLFQIEN